MNNPIDISIVELLGEDGRMSNSEIARRLNVSEATIRQRLKRLTSTGAIKITAQVNTTAFSNSFIVIVGIALDILPEKCLDKIGELPNMLHMFTVTGRYDIMAVFIVNSRQELSNVVETQLHEIEGVSRTETFIALKNCGMSIDASDYVKYLGHLHRTGQSSENQCPATP
ncbi:Lrp/AsnC family transcriptional regulator [Candidatus Latescibacterota bacterium]